MGCTTWGLTFSNALLLQKVAICAHQKTSCRTYVPSSIPKVQLIFKGARRGEGKMHFPASAGEKMTLARRKRHTDFLADPT